jgi:hypothetical protein
MPVVRVSEETWKRLQSWAVPLEDTPDDALRRVLDAAEGRRTTEEPQQAMPVRQRTGKSQAPRARRRRVEKFPQAAYRTPILKALQQMGGQGAMADVLNAVYESVKEHLTEADRQMLPSGTDIRWRNTAAWERFAMVKQGLLKSTSPHGLWELTDKGAGLAAQIEKV